MGCDVSPEQLWSWVDQDAPELDEHLAVCPRCSQRTEVIRRKMRIIAAGSSTSIPERIGPYRINRLLGEGGMGVVYLADQEQPIHRRVALKLIRLEVSNYQTVGRFESERQALALMNHPSIAQIFDAGATEQGQLYFAMEYIDGTPIDEFCRANRLDLRERLELLASVCEGIHHAHQRGILHRDIKPSNVLVTAVDGKAVPKIIDFGVIKASADLHMENPVLTEAGQVVGTTAYMSPEQARGKAVDRQTDIWAFGCLLYECVTDSRAFRGETRSDILASILKEDPDWSLIDPRVPLSVRVLLFRCLKKKPEERFCDIRDVRLLLEEALSEKPESVLDSQSVAARRGFGRRGVPWFIVALLFLSAIVATAVVFKYLVDPELSRSPRQGNYSINLPGDTPLLLRSNPSVAVSRNGKWIVYAAERERGPRLYLRDTSRHEFRPIPGTEAAEGPFFSPSGQWVGFFDSVEQKLKKVSVQGGAPITICAVGVAPKGASWGPNGAIVFSSSHDRGLSIVDEDGGQPSVLTDTDPHNGEKTHRYPHFLPDGRAVLFTVGTSEITTFDDADIEVVSLSTGQRKVLVEGGASPHYVRTGQLLYTRGGALMAVPFDAERLEVTGPAVRMMEGVMTSDGWGVSNVAVTDDGTLYYAPGGPEAYYTRLVWRDREGNAAHLPVEPGEYGTVAISPEGKRLAVQRGGANENIWVLDLARGTWTRLTSEWDNESPVWTPDGKQVTFYSNRTGLEGIVTTAADGGGATTLTEPAPNGKFIDPGAWSPDGKTLAYVYSREETGSDVWIRDTDGETDPWAFVATRFEERHPVFSPDGRWIAYSSDESGRFEVYVKPFPAGEKRWQLSRGGGTFPRWSTRGDEIFYRNAQSMMVVTIRTSPSFLSGTPTALFDCACGTSDYLSGFDVGADGDRFFMTEQLHRSPVTELYVAVGWADELPQRVSSSTAR